MQINRRQLATLFFCSLVPWVVGNGLLPLLPVYLTRLGASSAAAGYSLAVSYIAIALGALSAGWVSGRFHRRRLPLVITGLVGIPLPWLMGQVRTVWGFTALTAGLWFCGGLGLALTSILAGLSAGEHERGKTFGILALSSGLGALVGSLGSGWLVSRWGYTTMFDALAIFLALWPLAAWLSDEKEEQQPRAEKAAGQKLPGLGRSFYLLFAASLLVSVAGFFIVLIRSILMDHLKFAALEISSTSAVGGLVGMPFPLLMGWLSDRVNRKAFLIINSVITLAALILLAYSRTLWNFWIVCALQGITSGNGGVGNALVTDLVPREAMGKGLAIFSSAGWLGGVIGFSLAGSLLQNFGFGPSYMVGGALVLVAIALFVPIQARGRKIPQADAVAT